MLLITITEVEFEKTTRDFVKYNWKIFFLSMIERIFAVNIKPLVRHKSSFIPR